jgi:hypothetical protein
MPFQQQQGDSCGPCAASYVLEEFGKQTFNNFNDIQKIWDKVKLGANPAGLSQDYSDPTALAKYLKDTYGLPVEPCMVKGSPLATFKNILAYANMISEKEGINEIKKDDKKRAIAIYSAVPATMPPKLHYMLTKYSKNGFEVIDSNDNTPKWIQVATLTVKMGYSYAGACIIVANK